MKRTEERKIIIVKRDDEVLAVYEIADEELGIEVRLEKGVDYQVWGSLVIL
jgi:hypothetical protein